MTSRQYPYDPQYAVPPGSIIADTISHRGMTQSELATSTGLSAEHISDIISAKVEVTEDVALSLEHVLGVPASFWLRAEAFYQEQKARSLTPPPTPARRTVPAPRAPR